MELRDIIKKVINEELGNTKSDFERKADVFRKILNLKSYEGVCSYKFGRDHDDENKIGSVIVEFSHDWYRSSDKPNDLQRKLASISATKMDIKNIGTKFLGIENFYVGSYLVHCESSLNEQETPKSFSQKSPKYGEKKKHRPDIQGEIEELQRVTQYLNRDEGLDITVNDLVNAFQKSKEITLDNETWSQLENTESNEIEKGDFDAVIDIAKKYNKSNPKKLAEKLKSGDYNRPLIVKFGNRYHVVAGNTRLSTSAALGLNPKVFIATIAPSDNLQESIDSSNPKDDAFQKILKRVIPDGSVYEFTYELPYADEGEVNVIMKYSVLPTSRIMKMVREDGSEYDGLQLHLMIDELIWKSDFDKDWETIKRPHDLPTRFWSEFEDDMSELFRKRLGIKYVETYFKHPDISHI